MAYLPTPQGLPCFVHGPALAKHYFDPRLSMRLPRISPWKHTGYPSPPSSRPPHLGAKTGLTFIRRQMHPLKRVTALQGEMTGSGSTSSTLEDRSRLVELSLDGLEASQ
eukprot:881983-Rhodomonas_salina.3